MACHCRSACEAELPFVIASRFPNGAVAVATQGRTTPGQNWNFTPADVTVAIGAAGAPSGVFGHYRNLTLRFDASLGKGAFWHRISRVRTPKPSPPR